MHAIKNILHRIKTKLCKQQITKDEKILSSLNLKYDLETEKIIEKVLNINSNCIDIGCHKGVILDLMIKYAPDGKHWGFEPIPFLFDNLKKKYSPKYFIQNTALSNIKGQSEFNLVKTNPAYSGLVKRKYDRPETDEKIIVQTDLLDNVIPSETKIDLIKIDVEGGEMNVLKGAKQTILRNKPVIVFEFGLGAADFYGTTPEEMFEFLNNECNLNISLMEYFLREKEPLSIEEFSGHFNKTYNYYFIAYPKQ